MDLLNSNRPLSKEKHLPSAQHSIRGNAAWEEFR
jgi:hypothetical protein